MKKSAYRLDLTDRERALISVVVGATPLPQGDLEHLIARDDVIRVVGGDAFMKMPDTRRAAQDHTKRRPFTFSAAALTVIRHALVAPGQTPGAWRVSAGIARRLPPSKG